MTWEHTLEEVMKKEFPNRSEDDLFVDIDTVWDVAKAFYDRGVNDERAKSEATPGPQSCCWDDQEWVKLARRAAEADEDLSHEERIELFMKSYVGTPVDELKHMLGGDDDVDDEEG